MTPSSRTRSIASVPAVRRAGSGAGFTDPRRAPRRRACPAGTSLVTTAPAPVRAPSPIVARGDDHRVDPDERPVADRRPVLADPVVVGGDGPGADVGPLADLGIAEVAHVMLLGPGTQVRVLELGEVADLGATPDDAARAAGG